MSKPETYPEYLRRVGSAFAKSGFEDAAEVYAEAALRLSGAAVALRAIAALAKPLGGRPEIVRIVEIACHTANNTEFHE